MFTRLIALLAAVGLFAALASAGVVPLSRNSLIKIEGQSKTDDLAQSSTFTTFGLFNDGFTKEGGDPAPGTRANATVAQNSTVNTSVADKLTGDAALTSEAFAAFDPNDTSGPNMVHATNQFTVTFQVVNKPEPFSVSGAFDSNDPLGASAHFSLLQTSDPEPGHGKINISTDNALGTIIGGGLDFSESATLPVGTYQLFADSGSGSSGSGRGDPFSFGESTGVHFSFSVGSGAAAIPLPAAVWPGIVALGGVLGRLTYRRGNS